MNDIQVNTEFVPMDQIKTEKVLTEGDKFHLEAASAKRARKLERNKRIHGG